MADDGERSVRSVSSTRRSSENPNGTSSTGPQGAQQLQSQSSSAHFGTSSQISETSRRARPTTLNTQSEGYGTLMDLSTMSFAESSQGTINANPPARPQQTASPEVTRPRKPTISRRTTSTHVPHKGEEFSVDDDEDEVAEDQERQRERQRDERRAKLATGTLRVPSSTLRRRTTAQQPSLTRVESSGDEEAEERAETSAPTDADGHDVPSGEETVQADEEDNEPCDGDGEADLSDAESFTLKDRQEAINATHPFGIRIWKPALYKKSRSVQKTAEGDIHSAPGGRVTTWLLISNFLWTLLFGWWLALLSLVGAIVCICFTPLSESSQEYSRVLFGLSKYIFHPFGKYVKLVQDEAYAEEDEGEGRSISEYEQWQSGDIEEGRLFFGPVRSLIGRRRTSMSSASETQSLLGRPGRAGNNNHREGNIRVKRRLFGRGKWNLGRVVFFLVFYGIIALPMLLVSGICWLLVFTIPMGRVTLLLIDHLRRHPLALYFHSESRDTRYPGEPPSSILVCTYRAVGLKYWKYTIDGTNIFLINLLVVVAFTIFDFYVLREALHLRNFMTDNILLFALSLFSIIPLAYFIGQAVASISAQSSMGVGATVNAFFSTIVEVFLYCVALNQGKAQLVEGSLIGSIFAGILFLPGISMCFGALKRKTQRFNVKSAGVTSTMLLFAVIGAFGPTLFYQIYGSVRYPFGANQRFANMPQHELKCQQCKKDHLNSTERDCRRCFFSQTPAIHDRFYQTAVQPYIWFSAVMLFLSYITGLMFTLRTHAAVIWTTDLDEKKIGADTTTASQTLPHPGADSLTRQTTGGSILANQRSDIRDSPLYQRILGQSLRQVGLTSPNAPDSSKAGAGADGQTPRPSSVKSPHIVPPKSRDGDIPGLHLQALSEEDNNTLTRKVAEMVATAATVATRDATKAPQKAAKLAQTPARNESSTAARSHTPVTTVHDDGGGPHESGAHASGGTHDAPNWSKTKSAVILLTATLAYAVIAEILVDTVDAVLNNVDIDEKFLGITLFAMVPNTTEFLVRILSHFSLFLLIPFKVVVLVLTMRCELERYILRNERQHRPQHGNRQRLRPAGLPAADSNSGPLLRRLGPLHQP